MYGIKAKGILWEGRSAFGGVDIRCYCHTPLPPGMAVALVCVCRLGLGPTRSDGFPMHKLNHATTGPSLHRVELPPIRLSHCDIYYALDFSSLLAHTLSVHDSTAFIPPVAPHSNHTPCA